MSVAANYNMASTHFRNGDAEQARKNLDRIKEAAPLTPSAADYFYNLGDVALAQKDYQTAVDAFAQSLVLRPDDLDAKENYIYAKKMLQNQQNNQNQDNQNQDNQNNQDNQDNQDNKDNQDNQDKNNQNQDNQNNQNNQDDQKNNDNQNDNKQDQNGQQPKISPQAAQQMLQAIQAKEKETQDKVNAQKAKVLKSRQKDKNW
jgi:tetratricopeptide (TPR) repeat protein